MSREEHPPFDGDGEVLEGDLRPRRSAFERFRRVEEATPRPAFNRSLRGRLLARHDASLARGERGGWREVLARLLTPAEPHLGLAGVRGGALRLARYEAEDLTIVLKIEAAGTLGAARVTIYGALDSEALDDQALAATTVELASADSRVESVVDDLGNFMLEQVPVGLYRLTLYVPDGRAVVIEHLSLAI